jgi:hypothetical protein
MSRRYVFALLGSMMAVLSLPMAGFAQSTSSSVATHRLMYDSIEHRLSTFRHVLADPSHLKVSPTEDEPAMLEAYCDGDKLRLVVATYAQEAGHSIDRYYFRNDSLFFLYDRLEFPTGPETPNRVKEERLYFAADTLVRWLDARNAQHALSTPATRQRAKEALTRAAAFRQALEGCPDHTS